MNRARNWLPRALSVGLALLAGANSPIATAQIAGLKKSGTAAAEEAATDPMDRSTPRGAIVAFTRAVDRGDFAAAVRYLDLDDAQRRNAVSLAKELKSVIDRELHESISDISDDPGGSLDDGLAEHREHIGPLDIAGNETYITLLRVRDAQGLQIWLISSETLKLIPALADAGGRTGVETLVPAWTLQHEFLSLSLGHWIVLVILLLGTFTLLALFGAACNLLARKIVADPVRRGAWDAWYRATRWPAIVALTIIIQFAVIPSLGFPLSFRVIYSRIGLIAFVIVMTWLLRSGLSLTFSHARGMVRGKDRASTQSLMLLTERMLNAAIVVIAIIAVLILLGVESKTALAALGVVGVALALGAQKTVENLLGGIFLLSDRALAVGDYCTIANQSGVVEDVTLRSVRLRTTNQSLVSLPAGSLAQTGIENFASRSKMPVISTLRLRYGTSAAQLKRILAEIRTLLETNPMFETGTSFIGLVNFGPEAIELELFAFVLTNDGDRFRIVREELLLEIAARVDAAGSGLAPTRFVQMQPGADGTALSQAAAGSAAATREH